MFPLQYFNTYTWTSPDRKTHNQIDHVLTDKKWHPSLVDAQSFREAGCDTDHYLTVAKVRQRLSASK
jgi:hypothetical protein